MTRRGTRLLEYCRRSLPPLSIALALAGCSPHKRLETAAPSTDRSLYEVLLDHFHQSSMGVLRVDPRPLRPGADLASVGEDDLLPDQEERVRALRSVLATREILATDAVRDMGCVFSAGVPRPSGSAADTSGSRAQAGCGARAYTTLVFSAPEAAQDATTGNAVARIRAVRMTLSSISLWSVELRSEPGGWRIHHIAREFGISS